MCSTSLPELTVPVGPSIGESSCWGPTKPGRSGTMSNNVCNSTINPAYADSSIGILTS